MKVKKKNYFITYCRKFDYNCTLQIARLETRIEILHVL